MHLMRLISTIFCIILYLTRILYNLLHLYNNDLTSYYFEFKDIKIYKFIYIRNGTQDIWILKYFIQVNTSKQ